MHDVSNFEHEKQIDVLDIASVLILNIKTVIMITAAFMIAAVILSFISLLLKPEISFMPNSYSPKSLVILNNSSSSGFESVLMNSNMGALAGLAGLSGGSNDDSSLAIKLTETNIFIDKIDKEFNLSTIYKTSNLQYPKTSLKKIISQNLKINLDNESGLLEISYTDIDKVLATKITNKVTELLEEEFLKIDSIRNKNQFLLAEDNKLKVEQELERLALELIKFQKKYNLVDVTTVFNELMKQISTMQTSLLKKEVEIESYGSMSNIRDPELVRLQNEKLAILSAIDKLEKGIVGNYPPLKDLPELAFELERLQGEIEIQKTVYKTIIQQYETLKLTAGGTGPTFQVLEKADIPEKKSKPSRAKFCIVMSFSGLFLAIFFVYIRNFINNIKNDPEKMRRLKGEK